MPQLLWDASALGKRYAPENGTPTVNALFGTGLGVRMVGSLMGYAEAAASLRRRLNQGVLSLAEFSSARLALRRDLFAQPGFDLLPVDDASFLACIALIDQHNLNSSDAALLETYLRYNRAQPPGSPTCVLVASDQRLIRAADLEGLATLNPEKIDPADVPDLLAGY
jgi:predicted nucleic acid-binding protein